MGSSEVAVLPAVISMDSTASATGPSLTLVTATVTGFSEDTGRLLSSVATTLRKYSLEPAALVGASKSRDSTRDKLPSSSIWNKAESEPERDHVTVSPSGSCASYWAMIPEKVSSTDSSVSPTTGPISLTCLISILICSRPDWDGMPLSKARRRIS